MPNPPRRHWLQLGLSTFFVLLAIVAWAMVRWPSIETTVGWIPPPKKRISDAFYSNRPEDHPAIPLQKTTRRPLNRNPIGPAAALVAFISWKAFRQIRDGRLAKRSQR
jgi:hypothetical protein